MTNKEWYIAGYKKRGTLGVVEMLRVAPHGKEFFDKYLTNLAAEDYEAEKRYITKECRRNLIYKEWRILLERMDEDDWKNAFCSETDKGRTLHMGKEILFTITWENNQ